MSNVGGMRGVGVGLLILLMCGCNPPQHGLQFFEVTESIGLDAWVSAYGLSLGDWNGDQCLDLFIASHGRPTHLFENDCHGHFIDRIEHFGTEVTYRLHSTDESRQEKIFLSPSLAVENGFRINHETFLFHPPAWSTCPPPAYHIWRDLKTMAWHLRWRGEGEQFHGTIAWGIPARVQAAGFQAPDRMRASARSLDFSSTGTAGAPKGIDIHFSPFLLRYDTVISFDLQVKGQYAKDSVCIGSIGAHP